MRSSESPWLDIMQVCPLPCTLCQCCTGPDGLLGCRECENPPNAKPGILTVRAVQGGVEFGHLGFLEGTFFVPRCDLSTKTPHEMNVHIAVQ